MQPLLDIALVPEPKEKNAQQQWLTQTTAALTALAELGDCHAITPLMSLLDSPHAVLRQGMADVLLGCADFAQQEVLQCQLHHHDPQVKYRAALGLAYQGISEVAHLVYADSADKVLTVWQQLAATLTLGEVGEKHLLRFLDHDLLEIQHAALLLVLLKEWRDHTGEPARLLSALAAKQPKIRLAATEMLEAFPDPAAYATKLVKTLNERLNRRDTPWKIPHNTVQTLATMLIHAPAKLKVRFLQPLTLLFEKTEQTAWKQLWQLRKQRYAAAITAAEATAQQHPIPAIGTTPAAVQELAFGVYVGLAREQGSYHSQHRYSQFGMAVIDIRLAAIRGLIRFDQCRR